MEYINDFFKIISVLTVFNLLFIIACFAGLINFIKTNKQFILFMAGWYFLIVMLFYGLKWQINYLHNKKEKKVVELVHYVDNQCVLAYEDNQCVLANGGLNEY